MARCVRITAPFNEYTHSTVQCNTHRRTLSKRLQCSFHTEPTAIVKGMMRCTPSFTTLFTGFSYALRRSSVTLANKETKAVRGTIKGDDATLGKVKDIPCSGNYRCSHRIGNVKDTCHNDLHFVVGVLVFQRLASFLAIKAGSERLLRVSAIHSKVSYANVCCNRDLLPHKQITKKRVVAIFHKNNILGKGSASLAVVVKSWSILRAHDRNIIDGLRRNIGCATGEQKRADNPKEKAHCTPSNRFVSALLLWKSIMLMKGRG